MKIFISGKVPSVKFIFGVLLFLKSKMSKSEFYSYANQVWREE